MIVRGRRPDRYLIVANKTLRDTRLSFRARGVLAFILSWPDGHRMTSGDIAEWGSEGRDAIQAAFRELRTAGYMVTIRSQGSSGRWTTTVTVHDTPIESVDKSVDNVGITA